MSALAATLPIVADTAESLAGLEAAIRVHLERNLDELSHWIASTLIALTVEARGESTNSLAAVRQQTPAPRLCRGCRQRLASQGRHYCRRCRRRATEERHRLLKGEYGERARQLATGERVDPGGRALHGSLRPSRLASFETFETRLLREPCLCNAPLVLLLQFAAARFVSLSFGRLCVQPALDRSLDQYFFHPLKQLILEVMLSRTGEQRCAPIPRKSGPALQLGVNVTPSCRKEPPMGRSDACAFGLRRLQGFEPLTFPRQVFASASQALVSLIKVVEDFDGEPVGRFCSGFFSGADDLLGERYVVLGLMPRRLRLLPIFLARGRVLDEHGVRCTPRRDSAGVSFEELGLRLVETR